MSKPDQRAWLALFVDIADQPCLVVGGGAVAARKTRRLLAAGARVTLVAPTFGQAIAALVEGGDIIIHRRPFHLDDLGKQKLVVAATDDEAINTAIAQAARELDIPVNVAAPGRLSTVILPKVIDRAPVQIAVASGGASPALMRQLNRHLNALIPRAYGELATLLAEFRDEIGARFAGTDERRRFHDAIIDGPVSEQVFAGRHALARELIRDGLREGVPPASGEVYLVGAGPGDPELLTLRALRLMQKADVVVYDRLIGSDILDLIRSGAARYYVGKARDNHACTQQEINQLLVEHARAGKRVLRLKGGDPFVFGRGGEEIQALMAAGIPFQVVPGVTAATGCAAYAGIPLTHRDMAHACIFLTGHFAEGETRVDWRALAQPGQTLVFYMGVYNLAKIRARLLDHGMSPATPVAVIQNGTLPDQRVLFATLGTLLQSEIDHAVPGLVIVSETVKLSPRYQVSSASNDPDSPVTARFSTADRDSLYRIIAARRDMRHFSPGTSLDDQTLKRLLAAAHQAPSVGLMQPWRFIRVTDAALRERIASLVAVERDATAVALGERAAEFLRLKVEGIRECAELLVAALAPDDGTVFGRRTLPDEMALCSVACAIQNLWLAARAENLGLGWVSMFDPAALARLLDMPAQAKPVAILCLGPVESFYSRPMLEQENWRHGRPLHEMMFENGWGDTPRRTEMRA
ncbi:MAG: siroheme synthase CysG [Pseudomonadota bacterium]